MFMSLYEKLYSGEDNHVNQVIMREDFLIFFTTIPISMSIMNLKGTDKNILPQGRGYASPTCVTMPVFENEIESFSDLVIFEG